MRIGRSSRSVGEAGETATTTSGSCSTDDCANNAFVSRHPTVAKSRMSLPPLQWPQAIQNVWLAFHTRTQYRHCSHRMGLGKADKILSKSARSGVASHVDLRRHFWLEGLPGRCNRSAFTEPIAKSDIQHGNGSSNRPAVKNVCAINFLSIANLSSFVCRVQGRLRGRCYDRRRMSFAGEIFLCSFRNLLNEGVASRCAE